MTTSESLTYSTLAKGLHWTIAAGIVTLLALGWVMTSIPGITPLKLRYFNWHKWLGVTILVLSLLRLGWRLYKPAPSVLPTLSAWQLRLAGLMHFGLYGATLGVPLLGYCYSLAAGFPVVYLGLFKLPVLFEKNPAWIAPLKTLHVWSAYALAVAALLHALAALWHHFVLKDGVLLRMLPRLFRAK